MDKKFYEAPEMEEIKLTGYSALLDSSNPQGNMPDWGDGDQPELDPDDV